MDLRSSTEGPTRHVGYSPVEALREDASRDRIVTVHRDGSLRVWDQAALLGEA